MPCDIAARAVFDKISLKYRLLAVLAANAVCARKCRLYGGFLA